MSSRKQTMPIALVMVVLAALTIGSIAFPATTAFALWFESKTLSQTLNAATTTSPSGQTCTTNSNGVTSNVTISWGAAPDANQYVVLLRNASGTIQAETQPTTNTSMTLTEGLLSSLLQGLLDLLTGGGRIEARVVAVYPGGWRSAPTPVKEIRYNALLPTGLVCA